jgi:hypothetical protein
MWLLVFQRNISPSSTLKIEAASFSRTLATAYEIILQFEKLFSRFSESTFF